MKKFYFGLLISLMTTATFAQEVQLKKAYNSSNATAITCYYGEQTIITDSVAPDIYHLVDTTRGGGVETYNLNHSWDFSSSEWEHFVDDDNYWECANPIENKGATDAHWSMEKIYDFYMEKYNRNSFDGNGAKMVTLVNFGTAWGLGFFSGIFTAIGGATGNNIPRTFIELVGHEFSHGVVHYTAGLQYTDETGALSESYCNILGTGIEFWAIPEMASWLFANLDTTKYDMSDPNSSLSPVGTHYPDTYQGNYWLFGGDQNAIVHTNCAVQDYCFYLMSDGGSGTNDNSDDYNVDAIGIDKATDIFYRALTVYLEATDQFVDSRQATIQSAIDLYGECSNEVEQVINAWYAVGVGPDDYTNDLSLTTIISPANNCDLSAEEIVEVEVLHNFSGCTEVIPAGSSIGMTYQLDDEEANVETWILDQDFVEGETKTYTFSQGINLPDIGVEHELSIYVDYASDNLIMNNLIDTYSIERKYEYDGNNVGFEDFGSNNDGFYIHTGSYARAEIDTVAKNTGEYGFLMTVIPDKNGPSPIPNDPSLNFEQQEELISEICFCVDATDWEYVSLYFDLKQTHSMLYNFVYGSDSTEFLSSMRMLINGEQFGEQFHPETYFDDPFVTYNYDLSVLAGTYFEFCFQSKNYVDDALNGPPVFTYESQGDNTFLDNILFANQIFTGVKENETSDFTIYPNPANDKVYITSNKGTIISEVNIFNQIGQKVLQEINPTNPLDISNLKQGLYIIEIVSDETTVLEKLIVR